MPYIPVLHELPGIIGLLETDVFNKSENE